MFSSPTKNLIIFVFLCQLLAATSYALPSQAQSSPEQIKAVFLFKFFDYVTWPAGHSPGNTHRICVIGSSDLTDVLDYIASKKSSYEIEKIQNISKVDGCHLLYTADDHYSDLARLKNGNGILTVGENGSFHKAGGIIQMYEKDGKVKLSIALQNAEKQNIKISSRLLGIADVKK